MKNSKSKAYNNYSDDMAIFAFADRVSQEHISIHLTITSEGIDDMLNRFFEYLKSSRMPLKMHWYFYLIGKLQGNHGCIRNQNEYGFYLKREAYWWNMFMLNYLMDSESDRNVSCAEGEVDELDRLRLFSVKVWTMIDSMQDSALEEFFDHKLKITSKQTLFLNCLCKRCMSEQAYFQQHAS